MTINECVKRAREIMKVTGVKIAMYSEIEDSYVYRIENNKIKNGTFESIDKLSTGYAKLLRESNNKELYNKFIKETGVFGAIVEYKYNNLGDVKDVFIK